MKKIEILDCTLRDGGYINNWNFGLENIEYIINALAAANINYIECGFICNSANNLNQTLYSDFEQLKKIINKYENCNFALMMSVNNYNIDNLLKAPCNTNIVIRLSFHKSDLGKAISYALKIKEKGYKIFLQPTVITSYNENEIINLLNNCNDILQPDGIAIVDTLGEMNLHDISKVTKLFDKYLNKEIKLLFHGHNNFQLAFSNAITFIESVNDQRNVVVDASLMGIGRNSGNVCIELLTNYVNKYHNGNYNYDKILNIINDVMLKMKKDYEWGYTPKFMLNAKNRTHPYYSNFFIDNIEDISLMELNNILKEIPINEKSNYNKETAYYILKKLKNKLII